MTQSRPRLTPSDMFAYAFRLTANIVQDGKSSQENPASSAVAEDKNKSYLAKFTFPKEKKEVVLLCPATDASNPKHAVGAVPLAQALEFVAKQQQEHKGDLEPLFIIPFCEARPYSGLIPTAVSFLSWATLGLIPSLPEVRQHWTLLTIQGKECHFYDPKEKSSGETYSLDSIKAAVKPYKLSWVEKYLGWQAWNDDTHCGYFVGELIGKIISAFKQGTQLVSSTSSVAATTQLFNASNTDTLNKHYQAFLKENDKIAEIQGFKQQHTDYDGADEFDMEGAGKSEAVIAPHKATTTSLTSTLFLRNESSSSSGPSALTKRNKFLEQKDDVSAMALKRILGKDCNTVTTGFRSHIVTLIFCDTARAKEFTNMVAAFPAENGATYMQVGDTVTVTVSSTKRASEYVLEQMQAKKDAMSPTVRTPIQSCLKKSVKSPAKVALQQKGVRFSELPRAR